LQAHVASYNYFKKHNKGSISSFEVLKHDDYEIVLLEKVRCSSKDELRKRERYHIDKSDCVNKYKPHITDIEKQTNREKYVAKHVSKTKEKIRLQKKNFQAENKAKIKSQRRVKCSCPCGGTYCHGNVKRHQMSKMHKHWQRTTIEGMFEWMEALYKDSKKLLAKARSRSFLF